MLKRKLVHQLEEKPVASNDLPILSQKSELLKMIQSHMTTIVVGNTGSGKSTQLPQYLSEIFLNSCVVCTQPRRVAAVTIAQRVADEQGCSVGDKVGYTIRFDDRSSYKTKIKYATDGVLLREISNDHMLSRYSVVILDEAHERSLQTDLLMGLLRRLQDVRIDLRVVVMSATLEVDLFESYFKDTCLVRIAGRQFPVEVFYTVKSQPNYLDSALQTCLQIHEEEEDGGVLVFLPGQEDIDSLCQLLHEQLPAVSLRRRLKKPRRIDREPDVSGAVEGGGGGQSDFEVFPLHASLAPEKQFAALTSTPKNEGTSSCRRFIVSTNIAETSVTVHGIRYVVDSGYVKMRLLNSQSGHEMLKVMPVSQSQADQRTGRAGREASGKCFRLFQEATFEALAVSTTPEMERAHLGQTMLLLMGLHIAGVNPMTFPYPTPPSRESLKVGMQQLIALGAVSYCAEKRKDGKTVLPELTARGAEMAALPLQPPLALMLLQSIEFGCVSEMLVVVAMLSTDTKLLFLQPSSEADRKAAYSAHRRFYSSQGDLPALVNIWSAWSKSPKNKAWANDNFLSLRALTHASSIRDQLLDLLRRIRPDIVLTSAAPDMDPLRRCLASSLFINVACKVDNPLVSKGYGAKSSVSKVTTATAPYRTLRGAQLVFLHPSCMLNSLAGRGKLPQHVVFAELLVTNKTYIHNVTSIEGDWLTELHPGAFKTLPSSSSDKVDSR